MPMCGHCKNTHPKVSDVWNCFNSGRLADQSLAPLIGNFEQFSKESIESPTDTSKRYFSSCGTAYHRHLSIPESRNCYLQKSNKLFNAPLGISEFVFITQEGDAFHNSKYCRALSSGQRKAAKKFRTTHPIKRVSWRSLRHQRYEPCQVCVRVRSE